MEKEMCSEVKAARAEVARAARRSTGTYTVPLTLHFGSPPILARKPRKFALKPKEERETPIQKRILEALNASGFWAIRINSGGVPAAGGFYRGAPAGTPDICVIAPVQGWLEVKRKSGTARKSQLAWHARAESLGVRIAIVRSAAEALDVVMKWSGRR